MKNFVVVMALLSCASVYAGESGFIRVGKTYLVYRNGEKVGKTAGELGFNTSASDRKVASVSKDGSGDVAEIFYQTDDLGNTCYYYQNAEPSRGVLPSQPGALSCVHK
jgi:hypothetical protein